MIEARILFFTLHNIMIVFLIIAKYVTLTTILLKQFFLLFTSNNIFELLLF